MAALVMLPLMAQKKIIENNQLNLPSSACSTSTLEKLLRKHKEVKYSDMQIQELRLELWDHNAAIDKAQQELIRKRNHLIEIRQEIVQVGDPNHISRRINDKLNSVEKINNDISENLAGLGYKGVYLFACKTSSSYDTERDLHDKAMQFITPVAVERTNGSFIASVTELRRKEGYDDSLFRFITEKIQGTSNVEAEIINKHNRKEGYYIFMAKLNTKPLQKDIKMGVASQKGENPEYTVVFDAIRDKNMTKKILEVGASKEDVKKLEQEIAKWKDLVAAENARIKEIERNFIMTGNERIRQIYSEIEKLRSEYNAALQKLQKLITENTNTEFKSETIDKTIAAAIDDIDKNIRDIDQAIMDKEAERLFADYQILVTTTTDYFSKIAEEALASKDRLTDMYAKVEHYVRIVEMENDEYRKASGNNVVYQRYFDKIWLFPEPGDGDFFRVTVVVKFSLTKSKPGWRSW